MLRSLFSFFAVLFVAVSAHAVEAPKQTVGDWWVLKSPNGTLRTIVVKEVAPNGDFTLVDEKTGTEFGLYSAELNKKKVGDLEFSPDNRNFVFPLVLGKAWQEIYQVSSSRFRVQVNLKGTVAGEEEIILKLLNGTEKKLPAIRVENEHSDRGITNKITCWYVPEIRFAAKCSAPDPAYPGFEVVAYGKGADPKPQY